MIQIPLSLTSLQFDRPIFWNGRSLEYSSLTYQELSDRIKDLRNNRATTMAMISKIRLDMGKIRRFDFFATDHNLKLVETSLVHIIPLLTNLDHAQNNMKDRIAAYNDLVVLINSLYEKFKGVGDPLLASVKANQSKVLILQKRVQLMTSAIESMTLQENRMDVRLRTVDSRMRSINTKLSDLFSSLQVLTNGNFELSGVVAEISSYESVVRVKIEKARIDLEELVRRVCEINIELMAILAALAFIEDRLKSLEAKAALMDGELKTANIILTNLDDNLEILREFYATARSKLQAIENYLTSFIIGGENVYLDFGKDYTVVNVNPPEMPPCLGPAPCPEDDNSDTIACMCLPGGDYRKKDFERLVNRGMTIYEPDVAGYLVYARLSADLQVYEICGFPFRNETEKSEIQDYARDFYVKVYKFDGYWLRVSEHIITLREMKDLYSKRERTTTPDIPNPYDKYCHFVCTSKSIVDYWNAPKIWEYPSGDTACLCLVGGDYRKKDWDRLVDRGMTIYEPQVAGYLVYARLSADFQVYEICGFPFRNDAEKSEVQEYARDFFVKVYKFDGYWLKVSEHVVSIQDMKNVYSKRERTTTPDIPNPYDKYCHFVCTSKSIAAYWNAPKFWEYPSGAAKFEVGAGAESWASLTANTESYASELSTGIPALTHDYNSYNSPEANVNDPQSWSGLGHTDRFVMQRPKVEGFAITEQAGDVVNIQYYLQLDKSWGEPIDVKFKTKFGSMIAAQSVAKDNEGNTFLAVVGTQLTGKAYFDGGITKYTNQHLYEGSDTWKLLVNLLEKSKLPCGKVLILYDQYLPNQNSTPDGQLSSGLHFALLSLGLSSEVLYLSDVKGLLASVDLTSYCLIIFFGVSNTPVLSQTDALRLSNWVVEGNCLLAVAGYDHGNFDTLAKAFSLEVQEVIGEFHYEPTSQMPEVLTNVESLAFDNVECRFNFIEAYGSFQSIQGVVRFEPGEYEKRLDTFAKVDGHSFSADIILEAIGADLGNSDWAARVMDERPSATSLFPVSRGEGELTTNGSVPVALPSKALFFGLEGYYANVVPTVKNVGNWRFASNQFSRTLGTAGNDYDLVIINSNSFPIHLTLTVQITVLGVTELEYALLAKNERLVCSGVSASEGKSQFVSVTDKTVRYKEEVDAELNRDAKTTIEASYNFKIESDAKLELVGKAAISNTQALVTVTALGYSLPDFGSAMKVLVGNFEDLKGRVPLSAYQVDYQNSVAAAGNSQPIAPYTSPISYHEDSNNEFYSNSLQTDIVGAMVLTMGEEPHHRFSAGDVLYVDCYSDFASREESLQEAKNVREALTALFHIPDLHITEIQNSGDAKSIYDRMVKL